ncbi:MAG: hypothetical protein JSV39_00680 [Candidatus Aenigmatarchaeota archaeon]|nr:MAG: hypothetical protein JSV39_00680 [Candidatus Aenigmarchaeota archaeon]
MDEDKGPRVKWKDIMDKLSSIEDLQNLTQLDLINLKNEIEKIKLVSPSPIPPEIEEKVVELEKIAKNVDVLKKWKQTVEEVKFLRSKVMEKPPRKREEERAEEGEGVEGIEEVRKEIEEVREELRAREAAPPPPEEEVAGEMEEMRKEIEGVRKELKARKFVPPPPKEYGTEEIEMIRKDIENIRKELSSKKPAPPKRTEEKGKVEALSKEIEQIRNELKGKKFAPKPPTPINVDSLRKAIGENRKNIDDLKSVILKMPKDLPDLGPIKDMINENRRLVEELRSKASASVSEIPEEVRNDIQKLHEEVTKLEEEFKTMSVEKQVAKKPEAPEEGEMDSLRNEILTKLNDLNRKFGKEGPEGLTKVIETNKETIEKLKSLVYGEEVEMGNMRKEMEENKITIQELRNTLLGRPKGGIPPDPEMKRKMLRMEQRIEAVGRKLDKVERLKPIKLPKLPKPEVPQWTDIEKIKNDVNSIISRMGEFLTKDDMEKGFLEKRIKNDQKLVKDDMEKEMDEIKRAIVRNEDHINNLVSDMEGVKKEVTTVEKREWARVSELPEIENLRQRVDELEKKVRSSGGGPVFIE